jgi:hypothetical protein
MSSHPLNPVPSPEEPRRDPADPLLNPRPLPGHAPEDVPPRQPGEIPTPGPEQPPASIPGVPGHPLGPPTPQTRG